MSMHNRTLALTMCNLDETDLCLDLDDDLLSNENNENVFKKPAIQLLSEIDKSKNVTCENDLNAEDDLKVFKKFEPQNQSIFEELFQNDSENEEDELIKTQPILSSTQFDTSTLGKNNFEFKKPTQQINSELNEIQHFGTSQQVFRVTQPAENESVSDSRGLALLNILTDNKVWNYALKDLSKQFQLVKLDSQLIQNYTINYYFKKFLEYDLLMKSSETSIRKLPILCAWIKEITRKSNNATVLLSDSSEEIKGTLSNSIIKDHWSSLMIGSVLCLQDVCLLRVNYGKNCYHLNINVNNLLCVYYPNVEEPFDQVNKLSLKTIENNRVKKLIDSFEDTYTNFDYLSHVADMNSTKNSSKSVNTTSKGVSSHSNVKPAPYHIPPQYNKASNNNNNNQERGRAQSNAVKSVSSISITRTTPSNNNNNNQALNQPQQQQQQQQSLNDSTNRNFQFKQNNSNKTNSINNNIYNSSKTVSETNSIVSNKEKSNTTISNVDILNRTGAALSEDVFSQLIFGIEDEFLND